MTRVTADAVLLSKLGNCESVVELCDETGRLLGYFHPAGAPSKIEGENLSPISDEEIERCRSQRTGRSLTEILADLERPS